MVSWGCTAITHSHFGKVRGKALQILGDYPKKKKAVIIAEKTTKQEENRNSDWVKTEEEMA